MPLPWEPETHPVAPTTVLIAGSNDPTGRSTALPKRQEQGPPHRRCPHAGVPTGASVAPCRAGGDPSLGAA